MPGPITISDGGFCDKDSDEVLVYVFDYDAFNLAAGVELISVGTFIVTPDDGTLVIDSELLLTGNRKTRLRIGGGTVGEEYEIANRVTTNESPSQTKEKRFTLRITS